MAARRTRSPLPAEPDLEALKLSPEVAWYLQDRGIALPELWQVPIWKTPEPHDLDGAVFDPARVDKVLAAFRNLVHTQGRWAGQPMEPAPWQVAYLLAPVFGWVRWDDDAGAYVRVARKAYVDVPRKNGKTTIAGGVAIYLTAADGEQGAQVLAVAASKDQARHCFGPIKTLATKSPALRKYVKPYAGRIIHPASDSYFAVVASLGDLLHGANVHGAVIDELHVHKTRDVVDAVETGTGARDQPLILIITTPDDGKPGTIYAERRHQVEQLARRVITDPSQYGVIWGVAESEAQLRELGLDPFSVEAQRRANPGYGVSPTRAFLAGEATNAASSPASYARYVRLHLGIRTKQATRYIRLEDWDLSVGAVDEAALAGRECHGGIDMASVNDITALCWLFPNRDQDRYEALWRFWLPEERLPDLDRRTAGNAKTWVQDKFLHLTPGAVLDTSALSEVVDQDAQMFRVQSIGYDRWGANDVTKKAEKAGMTMVAVGQSYGSLSAPMKETLRLVLVKRLIHGANPVMRWMVDNLAVAMDPSGNVRPDKANAADKIDGVPALAMALKECMDAELVRQAPPASGRPAMPGPGSTSNLFRPTKRLSL